MMFMESNNPDVESKMITLFERFFGHLESFILNYGSELQFVYIV